MAAQLGWRLKQKFPNVQSCVGFLTMSVTGFGSVVRTIRELPRGEFVTSSCING